LAFEKCNSSGPSTLKMSVFDKKGINERSVTNIASGQRNIDQLIHKKSTRKVLCQKDHCHGALMGFNGVAMDSIPSTDQLKQAEEFFLEYFKETERESEFDKRWEKVCNQINIQGYYELELDEIIFGARTAWRNTARCSGRSQWNSLQIRDCRNATTVEELFEEICEHIKLSTNQGVIVPMMTVFPQRKPGRKDVLRIWNGQLISYAGYKSIYDPEVVIGDKGNVEFTQFCQSIGWKGNGGNFDVLPLILSESDGIPKIFEIPEEIIMRVNIKHPTLPGIEKLNLEWYALPAVSGMLMEIGGIQFPACPFSGWYAVTEIATRDLLDEHRYNLLQDVANALGYDTNSACPMWKDRVNMELTVAVLDSYKKSSATIVDHHTLAVQFMEFFNKEHKVRGGCPADWVWVTPPMSSGITPTFHQEMFNYHLSPSYEYQEPLWKKYKVPTTKKTRLTLRVLSRAIWFMTSLYMKKYKQRKNAYILYGTMTGKSQRFASKLTKSLDQLFQTKMLPLNETSFRLLQNMGKLITYLSENWLDNH